MILTITLNPSVDISYKLPGEFRFNTVNRVADVSKTAGGKGLNVTRVLKQLDEEVAATGFLGGTLGEFIHEQLKIMGVNDFFVPIDGETRNCIAVLHDGKQTEILENGPNISSSEGRLFLEKVTEMVEKANYIVISGSLPKGIPNDFYNQILTIAGRGTTPVLLDTKSDLLEHALHATTKPFLIKPNQEELEDLLGIRIVDESDMLTALKSDILNPVQWVVATTGSNGAYVKHNKNVYRVRIPEVNAVNPVGSGDSVIAGFASGLSKAYDENKLIKYGLAMGVLNAMEEKTGEIDPANIDWCTSKIEIEKL